MWNISESDKRYFDRKAEYEEKRNHTLAKARARGEAAKKWFDVGNKLTKETQPEFNKLMKETDKNFDS